MIAEAATIDILYVSYNRFEMTVESLKALLENTPWDQVKTLYVVDDGSTDGTREWLEDVQVGWKEEGSIQAQHGTDMVIAEEGVGGPVAAINWYLDAPDPCDTFAKIDNDFVVCPGWLDVGLRLHYLNPDVDLIGFEPMLGHPKVITETNTREWELVAATHIGGKGLIRRRAFERSGCRPTPHGAHGYQGFTQWQTKHPDVTKAWVSPDFPMFGLDQLPYEPWRSATTRYVEEGWQRRWPEYDPTDTTYWQWWVDESPGRIVA